MSGKFLVDYELRILRKWRPYPFYELVSYILMFASVPMLAFGIKSYSSGFLEVVVLSVLCLYCGFFGAIMWNDVTDKEIDRIVHPERAIPSGVVSSKTFFAFAVILALCVFVFSVLISPWCLVLVVLNSLFVGIHNKFLKQKIKFPAYSEIFTPLQWLTVALFGFVAVWSLPESSGSFVVSLPILGTLRASFESLVAMLVLVLFTYFADDAHDVAEGIHDVKGDQANGVQTYATSFGTRRASFVSLAMFVVSGVFGVLLWYFTLLSYLFLIGFLVLWFWIVSEAYKMVKTNQNNLGQMGKRVGRRGFDYLLLTYTLIFFDVLWQLLAAGHL